MFKKFFIFFWIITIFLSITTFTLASEQGTQDPPLFVLKKDDKTVYILGTAHILPLRKVLSETIIDLLLNKTDLLMIEHLIENTVLKFESQGLQLKPNDERNAYEKIVDSEDLHDLIIPALKQLSKTEKVFSSCNISSSFDFLQLLTWKPWIVNLFLGLQSTFRGIAQTGGCTEDELSQLYSSKGKSTHDLETIQEVYKIMDTLNLQPKDYIKAIDLQLYQLKQSHNVEEALKSYNYQNALQETVQQNDPLYLSAVTRNELWVGKIIAALNTHNSICVAVGMGHLPSEKGLLKLLTNKGFTIHRIDHNGAEHSL